MNAKLIGSPPPCNLGYTYVEGTQWDAVVIGSLTLGQLLVFNIDIALEALSKGIPVLLYEPGLPEAKGNRSLSASLASRKRELKNWGVIFTDGGQKKLITAEEARTLVATGKSPAVGAVLTPLAKEILQMRNESAAGGR